jgi:hypothetical protein
MSHRFLKALAALSFPVLSLWCEPAAAIVSFSQPQHGARVEPGDQLEVHFSVDNNSADDRFLESVEVSLSLGPEKPFEMLATYPVSEVMDPIRPGVTQSRRGILTLTVPDVVCSYCQLFFKQIPGRGDYDNTGFVRIAIGTDFQFEATSQAGSGEVREQPTLGEGRGVPEGSKPIPAEEDLGSGIAAPAGASSGSASGCSLAEGSSKRNAGWMAVALCLGFLFTRRVGLRLASR